VNHKFTTGPHEARVCRGGASSSKMGW